MRNVEPRAFSLLFTLLAIVPAAASAQAPFSRLQYLTDRLPTGLAVADLNGDGIVDIATANSMPSNTASLLFGLGGGEFALPVNYPAGNGANCIIVADLNADSVADLLVANRYAPFVTILTGTGGGAFSVSSLSTPVNPYDAAAGDFNNDGLLDIIASNTVAKTQTLYVANGFGGYVLSASVGLSAEGRNIAAVDWNGDGYLDMVGTSTFSNCCGSIVFNFGNGAGTFPTGVGLSVGMDPRGFVVEDLNNDNILDIAIVETASNDVRIFQGGPTFGLPTVYPAWTQPLDITINDMNNDGKRDLIVSTAASTVGVLVSTGTGFVPAGLFQVGAMPNEVFVGDVSGDGNIDIVTANSSATAVSVLKGFGNGNFEQPLYFSGLTNTANVIAGDFNLDGRLDAAYPSMFYNIFGVSLGDGGGGFGARTSFTGGVGLHGVVAGDLNNDSKLDIGSIVYNNNRLNYSLGDGAGNFGAPKGNPVGTNPSSAALGDLNSDSYPDIVVANSNDNKISLLLSNGVGGYQNATSVVVGSFAVYATLGDVNNDGLLDAACSVSNAGASVSILLGNGAGGLTPHAAVPTGTGPGFLLIEDVTADGSADLLVAQHVPAQVTFYMGNGTGNFVNTTFISIGVTPTQMILADVNRDGKQDLVVGHTNNFSVLYSGDGIGNFTYSSVLMGVYDRAADFNNDGLPDLIGTSAGGGYNNKFIVNINNGGTPAGVALFGTGTPGCGGKLGINSASPPNINNQNFGIVTSNAPLKSLGALIITDVQDAAGQDVFSIGALLHVDLLLSNQIFLLDIYSDPSGVGFAAAPVPNDTNLINQNFYAQTLWVETGDVCTLSPYGFVSSRGLALTILP